MSKEKEGHGLRWAWIIIIIIAFLFVSGGYFISKLVEESNKELYRFYEEECPNLGAEMVERKEGSIWYPECFKQTNGTANIYSIIEINEEYYLKEK